MSTVYTYYDEELGAWRNRLAGREPLPARYREVDAAVRSGRSLAELFGADHYVTSRTGEHHRLTGEESDTA